MRSNEERLQMMHDRAHRLKCRREGRKLLLGGSVFSVLLIAMAVFTAQVTVRVRGVSESIYAGASMFDVSTGGFVLTAVLAFMAGVVITVTILKYRGKIKDSEQSEQSNRSIEGREKT